jgi:integrase
MIRETKVARRAQGASADAMLVVALANLETSRARPAVRLPRTPHGMRGAGIVTARRRIKSRLTPHCCRHGFATELLRRGVDVVTVAWLGGWASPAQVLKTYGHAMKRRDQTDILADEPLTHAVDDIARSARKIRLT